MRRSIMAWLKKVFIKSKRLQKQTEELTKEALDSAERYGTTIKGTVKELNESVQKEIKDIAKQNEEVINKAKGIGNSVSNGITANAQGLVAPILYTDEKILELKEDIENQGAKYRELNQNKTTADAIMIGGESLLIMINTGVVPDDILEAYASAYPDLSQEISFLDRAQELDGAALTGLISGVKGKLFEQQYIEYLNDGNLPDGYTATLAESATQKGWDIAIEGSNNELASVIQAKATDSISYIKEAIEKYPNIDIVTTDEVYSHLVMSGVSEGIINSGISQAEITGHVQDSITSADPTMDFTPPLLTLAFIAFTSYKDNSLSLYEKALSAGDRTGKTYLSYLIGGSVAVITNTWWLGVVSSVGSRLLSDSGRKNAEMYENLKKTKKVNQDILKRLKVPNRST